MRSLNYANAVVNGDRKAPDEVITVAQDYINIINDYISGNYINGDGFFDIDDIVHYEFNYLKESNEWNDALVFAVVYGLIKGDFFYSTPRKNGKTRFIYHVMRFIHLYKDNMVVGCYTSTKAMGQCVMSDFVHGMFNENYISRTNGNTTMIKGKNNQYILFSENSPSETGASVDILLVDEVLQLRDKSFNNIQFKNIMAVSSAFSHPKHLNLTLDEINKTGLLDNKLIYTSKIRKYDDITWDEIVKVNPTVEVEGYYNIHNNINSQFLKKQYERFKFYAVERRPYFMTAHLNIEGIKLY